jgi:hypothetical protein
MSEPGDLTSRQEPSAVARRTVLRAAGLLGLTGAGAAALSACVEESGGSPSAAPAVADCRHDLLRAVSAHGYGP